MTEQKLDVLGAVRGFGNKIIEKAQNYTLDRLVWCIATAFLCWTEVQNYHEYIFWQRIWIMAGVGIFYCLKLGYFAKGKRLFCFLATAAGAALTVHLVQTNYYVGYYYLNLPIGVFTTVLLNLFILVIYNAIKERRFPLDISPALLLVLLLLVKQSSVYDYKQYYLYMLITFLPFILMKKGYRTRGCMLNGMLDGMCIGFFLIQGYAWMHRPYNYEDIRYTGISNACTTMSRIYLAYFAAWLIRYVQAARRKLNFFNAIHRVFCWLMAAFVLSLEYLTGSRSAVLAMILMTVIAVAVRYIRPKEKWWKNIGKFILWPVNCACIGLVSLALFPTAYASVRYLPAYFNQPDYMDATGYRLLSRPIQEWGENFGWNFEYDEVYAVMAGDDVDSPKYAAFADCASYNLGRIIPGAEEYLAEALGEELLESNLTRVEYYFEQGMYTQEQRDWWVAYWNSVYGESESAGQDAESVNGEDVLRSDSTISSTYKLIIEKLLSTLVLRSDAEEISADTLEAAEPIVLGSRGDSAEYPWYTAEEYPGNGMALRLAIHEYAISKLNTEGHKDGTFAMWVTSWNSQPHAHNIFLIEGYDFGIPSMMLMILLFAVTFLIAMYNAIRFGRAEYLLPALLVAGMTVFGWFESGFTYKTGITMWIFLCVIFTDILRVKKPQKEKVKERTDGAVAEAEV